MIKEHLSNVYKKQTNTQDEELKNIIKSGYTKCYSGMTLTVR